MHKLINVIKAVINALMTLVIIIGLICIILYFLGIVPFVVESGSMEPTIQTGSISFINQKTKYEDIKENDIIAFKLPVGTRVTHRVIKISDEGFVTKGDNNDVQDELITTQSNFIGKNIFSIPRLGFVIKLMQTPRGKIVAITIIFIIFLSGILMDDNEKKKKNTEYIHDNKNENDNN